jgi:DNA-binding NtrC family response regulator
MIEEGLFRKDLFFRLGVIMVHVPSLNERREDIVPLVKHFILEFNKKFERKFTSIAPEAEKALMAYRWTGNVRELKNLVEKAVLIGTEPVLEIKDLGIEGLQKPKTLKQAKGISAFSPLPADGIDLALVQRSLEKFYIEEAFKMAGGNESKAARLLNINHHTFRYRRKKLK